MVIGIDAREAVGRPAGKGRYTLEMLRRLPETDRDNEFVLYGRERLDASVLPERTNVRWELVGGPGPLWHRRAAKLINRDCDAYLSTTSYLTPQLLTIPYALVVYDLIAFKDLAIPQRRARLIERRTLRRAARRAGRIVTISQATADDLTALFPESSGRITVTPLAADRRFRADLPTAELRAARQKFQLPASFVLTTGTIEPRKNQARLIRAYGRLPEAVRRSTPLVLVGKAGWEFAEVTAAMAAVGERFVRHLDYVSDADLAALYATCTIFCYPSLYEGFGLPVLEAMQSGAPVITSNRSSLPEVGGAAVGYVDPESTGEICEALAGLLGNAKRRRELRQAGLARAAEFSWSRTARQTIEALHKLTVRGAA